MSNEKENKFKNLFKEIPGFGQLPLRPGEIIVDEGDKVYLDKLNIKSGNPIPADMAKKIEEIQKKIDEQTEETLNQLKNKKPIEPPQTFDFKQLNVAKQEEIIKAIKNMQQNQPSINNLYQAPDILESFKNSPNSLNQNNNQNTEKINLKNILNNEKTHSVLENSETEKTEESVNQGQDDEGVSVSEEDEILYLKSKLEATRFTKTYNLLNDNLIVQFRTLKTIEAQSCKDIVYKNRRGLETENEIINNIISFRLLWALDYIVWKGNKINLSDMLDNYLSQTEGNIDNKTFLRKKYIHQIKPLDDESIWFLILNKYNEFELIVKKMDDKLEDPNFFLKLDTYISSGNLG